MLKIKKTVKKMWSFILFILASLNKPETTFYIGQQKSEVGRNHGQVGEHSETAVGLGSKGRILLTVSL